MQFSRFSRWGLTWAILCGGTLSAPFAPLAWSGGPSWIPPYCTIETWCVVRATECSFTHFTHPQGLDQGHAQYSVLRRAIALCQENYGQFIRREFLSPVEAVPFASEVETSEEAARTAVLSLCQVFRNDWVSAAPVCEGQR